MLLNQLQKRRSIRKYKDQKIEKEKIDNLKEALLRSPTSRGRRPWEFIFVENREMLAKLALSKSHGSSFLKNAALAVVILADPEVSDVWVEDTVIAAIIVQLTAESMGLGGCWVQIRNRPHDENISAEEYLRIQLKISDHLKILSIVGFGYPDESKPYHPKEELPYAKIHKEVFKG